MHTGFLDTILESYMESLATIERSYMVLGDGPQKRSTQGYRPSFCIFFLHTIDWNIMRESTLPTFFLNIKLTVVLFDVERVNDQHERRTSPHEK